MGVATSTKTANKEYFAQTEERLICDPQLSHLDFRIVNLALCKTKGKRTTDRIEKFSASAIARAFGVKNRVPIVESLNRLEALGILVALARKNGVGTRYGLRLDEYLYGTHTGNPASDLYGNHTADLYGNHTGTCMEIIQPSTPIETIETARASASGTRARKNTSSAKSQPTIPTDPNLKPEPHGLIDPTSSSSGSPVPVVCVTADSNAREADQYLGIVEEMDKFLPPLAQAK